MKIMIANSNKSYRVTCSFHGPAHSSAKGRVWVSYLCYIMGPENCIVSSVLPPS